MFCFYNDEDSKLWKVQTSGKCACLQAQDDPSDAQQGQRYQFRDVNERIQIRTQTQSRVRLLFRVQKDEIARVELSPMLALSRI